MLWKYQRNSKKRRIHVKYSMIITDKVMNDKRQKIEHLYFVSRMFTLIYVA